MIQQIREIKELHTQERKSILELGLKLSEELGELSEAILTTENAPGCGYKSQTKNITKERILEECVDIIIVTFCIVFKSGFSFTSISDMLKNKINKWTEKSLKS